MRNKLTLKALFALVATFVFAGVAFGSVKAQAAEAPAETGFNDKVRWMYDAEADELKIQFKNESDAQNPEKLGIFFTPKSPEDFTGAEKWKATKVLTAAEIKTTTGNAVGITAKAKAGGLGAAVTADTTIVLATAKDTSTPINYTGSSYITIKKEVAEIKTVVLDYAKTVSGDAATASQEASAIYSIGYKEGSGSSTFTEYIGKSADQTLKDGFGKTAGVFGFVEWTTVGPKDNVPRVWHDASELNALKLNEFVNSDSKVIVYFRVKGSGSDDYDSKNSYIKPSKERSLTLKKAGKTSDVKLEVKNLNFIKLKNGYDYQVVASGSSIDADGWTTILPYNKEGEAATKSMATGDFKAVKFLKTSSNANAAAATDGDVSKTYYTTTKVSKLGVDEVVTDAKWEDGEDVVILYYRKSAKSNAPAAKEVKQIVLNKPAVAPNKEDYTAVEFDYSVSGTAISFKFKEKLEYAIIKSADFNVGETSQDPALGIKDSSTFAPMNSKKPNAIDYSTLKWSALTSSKGTIKPNSKTSSYKTYKDAAGSYNDKDLIAAREIAVGDYILVRFKGAAGSKSVAAKFASEIAIFRITESTKKATGVEPHITVEQVYPAPQP